MKPLIVLVTSFLVALFIFKITSGNYAVALPARIAMALMLAFTAIGHFAFTKGMALMIPRFVPFKKAIVLITGIIEIMAATGLLIPALRELTGWLLIVFFVLLLPANIKAAIDRIDYQKGTTTGNGITYLWFRVPLQVLFILWVYYSAIKY